MFPTVYQTIYSEPGNHHPPDDPNITTDTEHPHLNSHDYAKRPLNRILRMHNAWECVALNEENQISLATNKLTGREWHSSLWGFEAEDVIEDKINKTNNFLIEKACFKLQCHSLISCLRYSSKNIILLALHSGHLQIWSTKSEVRNSINPYCLFMFGEQCEHDKPILCLDVFKKDSYKCITGGKDCKLKIWDLGKADLYSINTFNFAHSDVITGIASSPQDASIFTTCSLDKSALLWDDRLPRPAIAIYENHSVRFKTIAWSDNPNVNEIYVGDESGVLYSIDTRKPKEFIESLKIFNRPIRKIAPFGSKTAIIGDTNVVKAIASDFTVIYENSNSQHFVRDIVWRDSNKFLTIGFDGKMRIHELE